MKIAVLGTGMVGRTIADRAATLGHDVVIGTRDMEQTLARTEPDWRGDAPVAEWVQAHPAVRLLSFADAAAHGEVVVNATPGEVSLAALKSAGSANLAGKVILDAALPLDRSEGWPPLLSVVNNDSLGEQIQRAHPEARVVKSLNTMLADVMVDPARIPGHHNVFVSGDDADAKATVRTLLGEFGWSNEAIVDLGDISTARGTEMYARLLFEVSDALGTFDFNLAIVRK
ncbi:NADPH-dependent F420 reductase [Streptomyces solaniscabiei]|uniref:NADPH-dependent F420 reductase n=1 Tax=Streptomyces solaniscabiei TaxID=2683255 RepID=UPI001CE2E44F|nr:NAD(P)-binding domain-containing protein [Streptomyces solaniscabiei]